MSGPFSSNPGELPTKIVPTHSPARRALAATLRLAASPEVSAPPRRPDQRGRASHRTSGPAYVMTGRRTLAPRFLHLAAGSMTLTRSRFQRPRRIMGAELRRSDSALEIQLNCISSLDRDVSRSWAARRAAQSLDAVERHGDHPPAHAPEILCGYSARAPCRLRMPTMRISMARARLLLVAPDAPQASRRSGGRPSAPD